MPPMPNRGPGGAVPRGGKNAVQHPWKVLGRLLAAILQRYKVHCLCVLVCIVGSTAANVAGNLFLKTLIDEIQSATGMAGRLG